MIMICYKTQKSSVFIVISVVFMPCSGTILELDPTFSKLTLSAMTSSPTVTVEEIDGCSSNVGRARLAEDFRGMHGPDPESCGRARSPREVAHLERRRTSLKTCSCRNFWAAQLGRPLEL
jgi:hypothetical protein